MPPVPLLGEPLALDLVNTRFGPPDGPEHDVLADDDGLRSWLADQRHRLAVPTGDVDLPAVRALRDHVRNALDEISHRRPPPAAALAALSAAIRAAPAHRELSWSGTAVIATEGRTGDATHDLLAVLAEAVADLLTDPAVDRVRCCAAADCRSLFLAANPRRQWCSSTRCGNRVRVARNYQRRRGPTPR